MKMLPWGGRLFGRSATLAAAAGLLATGAQAQTSITNNNSVITVNANSPNAMTAWTIGGVSILNQQSFYYRIGAGSDSAVSTISSPTVTSSGGMLTTTYANSSFSLSILYSLVGGSPSSGVSDLSEQITIQSLNNTALTGFHFYQYASFIGAGNVILTQNPRNLLYTDAYVANSLMSVSESVDTGLTPANEGETDSSVLANILAGNTLNDSLTSTTGQWGFEWDKDIAANGTLILSKDLGAMVPEPSTWALFSLGLGVVALQLYRRRNVKALATVKA